MRLLITFLVLLGVCGPAAATVTLQVNAAGKLTGATSVDVGGNLYDVAFVEGTCASVFSGCDSVSDFAFSNAADALLASQALLDQVFVDGPAGQFDSSPGLTAGCYVPGPYSCTAITPYGLGTAYSPGSPPFVPPFSFQAVFQSTAQNRQDPYLLDSASTGLAGQVNFTSIVTPGQIDTVVWARFTPSVPSVPEPSTWATMLLGFAGIGVAMRRTRAKTSFERSAL